MDDNGDSDLAEWFVKVDADTFLFPENMKRYVKEKGWSPNEHHYFRHILKHRIYDSGPIIAGAAVFFSRETLKAAASVFRKFKFAKDPKESNMLLWDTMKCQDAYTEMEEIVTAWCLKEHFDVDADPVLDSEGQELGERVMSFVICCVV